MSVPEDNDRRDRRDVGASTAAASGGGVRRPDLGRMDSAGAREAGLIWKTPRGPLAFCFGVALVFGGMAYRRFVTFHNSTYDLAFYARMAWGLVRGDLYDPVVGAHVFGLHLSAVLIPLGALGEVFGVVPVLLLAQSLSAGGAAWVFSQMGREHLGARGAYVGPLLFLFHPNLGHVLGYEFHVGTLALFPLALIARAVDRRDAEGLLWASLGVLACREDLALVVMVAASWVAWSHRPVSRDGISQTHRLDRPDDQRFDQHRRASLRLAIGTGVGAFVWLLIFVAILLPRYGPNDGSVSAHFGHLGGSLPAALLHCVRDPLAVLAHLGTTERVTYLFRLAGPLLLLPLCSKRTMSLAAPTLAVVLLSQFPTTTEIYSHYFTSALPFFVAGTISLVGRLRNPTEHRPDGQPLGNALASMLPIATLAAYFIAGGGPLAARAPSERWARDETTNAGESVMRVIAEAEREAGDPPRGLRVQAPHVLMPHLAERRALYRPVVEVGERRADIWVLDVSHRARYGMREDLLRTQEEPLLREWLTRRDRGLVHREGPFAVFVAGADPRAQMAECSAEPARDVEFRGRLTECLSLLPGRTREALPPAASLSPLVSLRSVFVVAEGPCPPDLALRIGDGAIVQICDGYVSPALFRAGDVFEVYIPAHLGLTANAEPVTSLATIGASGAPVDPADEPADLLLELIPPDSDLD